MHTKIILPYNLYKLIIKLYKYDIYILIDS